MRWFPPCPVHSRPIYPRHICGKHYIEYRIKQETSLARHILKNPDNYPKKFVRKARKFLKAQDERTETANGNEQG